VQDVNALSARIAALNRQIGNASGPAVAHLVDEQRVAVGQLAELVDIQAIERQSGGLDVVLSNGRPLALADIPYPLDVASVGPSGYADITSGGSSVTAGITGGRIGGLLELRDRTVPAYMARLDELAHGVATQINSLHATGFDLAGNAGGVFFEPPAAVAGAARTMALDATLAGDPSLIAAAGTPAPGDNQVARSLAALRDARLMAGGSATFGDAWGQLVYAVGADASAAQAAFRAQQSVVRQVEALRENAAGISIDQEAAMMLRFQRAYEANARFFSVVDQSLTVLLNLGRA
jgi:flagellar hook-associated protein 1 FlgK